MTKKIGNFYGQATLGSNTDNIAKKLYVVVVRGIKNRWKQIIVYHLTRREAIDSNLLKDLMIECITSVESSGLHVVAFSSDMDSRNRSLWTSLNIHASKYGRVLYSNILESSAIFLNIL